MAAALLITGSCCYSDRMFLSLMRWSWAGCLGFRLACSSEMMLSRCSFLFCRCSTCSRSRSISVLALSESANVWCFMFVCTRSLAILKDTLLSTAYFIIAVSFLKLAQFLDHAACSSLQLRQRGGRMHCSSWNAWLQFPHIFVWAPLHCVTKLVTVVAFEWSWVLVSDLYPLVANYNGVCFGGAIKVK